MKEHTFATVLRVLSELRRKRGMRQPELVPYLNRSVKEVSFLETGKRSLKPSIIDSYLSALESKASLSCEEWMEISRAFIQDLLDSLGVVTPVLNTHTQDGILFEVSFPNGAGMEVEVRTYSPQERVARGKKRRERLDKVLSNMSDEDVARALIKTDSTDVSGI